MNAAYDAWVDRARHVPIEDEIARRGIRLRGKNEKVGPCPKCGGTDRFSINCSKGVWNCRHCDKGGDVIEFVRHSDGVDFVTACKTLNNEPPPNGGGEPAREVVTAKFNYQDEDGKVLFGARRIEYQNADGSFVLKDGKHKKTFRQGRPGPDNSWIPSVDGVRVVPYRLPEILEANQQGKIIFIVEGEAKADLLWSWGLPATCNAGGAGKWRREHSEFLNGADVVILPDNDGPGRAHATAVTESLKDIASSARVLEIPGLGPKGDVKDWDGDARQLNELLAAKVETKGEESGLCERDFGEDTTMPPPREWLLGTTFCRTFISSLLAAGGVGKTAVRYAQFLSLAAARKLTDEHVHQRCRVLVISLEDDDNELKRRMLAVMKHHGVTHEDIKGWLFVSAPGRSAGKLLEMDPLTKRARIGELAANIEAAIVRRKPDLISLDPFVKSHSVEENGNTAIDEVVQILTDLAAKHNVAIDAPHHVSKGAADPGNADKGRGASAMVDAARLVKTLTAMSVDEAKTFGVKEEDRKQFIRVDNGKVNIARSGGAAQWFELIGVSLENGTEAYPSGDTIQVAKPWQPPEMWADLTDALLNQILDKIDAGLPDGDRYSDSAAAKTKAAWRVVANLAPHKTEGQAKQIIRAWIKTGLLEREEYHNEAERKDRVGLRVNNAKRPGTTYG